MCSCRELRDIILVPTDGVGVLVAGDVFVPGVTRDRSGTPTSWSSMISRGSEVPRGLRGLGEGERVGASQTLVASPAPRIPSRGHSPRSIGGKACGLS